MTKGRLFFILGAATIALFCGAIMFIPLNKLLMKPLVVNEEPGSCDAIVVLSAGFYASGSPDIETMMRLKKGVELAGKFRHAPLICVGGKRLRNGMSYAQCMAQELLFWSFDEKRILIEANASNTYDDIVSLLKNYQGRFNFDNAVFITSPYHSFRVKKILDKIGCKAAVVSCGADELEPWLRLERLGFFYKLAREYGAILYFKMKSYI